MEWLVDLITDNKIPVGFWAKQFADWAKVTFKDFFDIVTVLLKVPMDATSDVLLAIPPLVLIALIAAVAYLLQRNWRSSSSLTPVLRLARICSASSSCYHPSTQGRRLPSRTGFGGSERRPATIQRRVSAGSITSSTSNRLPALSALPRS